MASIKEVEDWISKRIYPHVARTSDPLIVRVSRFSLLVNDTNFYAKIKNGLGYKGYLIYSSGLGTPILEESVTNETEFLNNDTFKKFISESGRNNTNKLYEDTANMQVFLQDAAKSWLDTLELEIAKQPNDNAIKKAIDRLCWQLHYDITESHTNFVDVFGQDDFSDVQIDRYPMDTEYWDGITLTTAISDSAGVTYKKDYGVGSCTVTIEDKGYLKDFDDHLTTGTYRTGVVGDKTVVIKGSLMTVFDEHLLGGMYDDSDPNTNTGAIKTFDDHLLKNSYDGGNGAFKKFNDALNDENSGSLIKIGTKLVPDGANYYSISECLRDKNEYSGGTYSIARSLREGTTQTSVSQATYDQTVLEENKFNEISVTKLGDFGSAGHKTLYATLGEYTDSTKNNLSEAVGYTTGDISIDEALGVTSGNTTSVAGRIGDFGRSIPGGNYRSLFDTISGISGYANPNMNSLYDAIGFGTGARLSTRIGVPLDEDGNQMASGGESLFGAIYRHPGFLRFQESATGWPGAGIPTSNASLVSNMFANFTCRA